MKLKLSGAALGALMVGLLGAGEAKADAIAYSMENFTGAYFSAATGSFETVSNAVNLVGTVAPVGGTGDKLTNTVFLDSSTNATPAGTRSFTQELDPAHQTVDPTMAVLGSYSGGQNNFGFTATNTNFSRSDSILVGNLLSGVTQSSTVAETQLTNDHNGGGTTTSGTATTLNMVAHSNITLQLNVAGTAALYAATSNSNAIDNSALAQTVFQIIIKDHGLTQTGAATTILNFQPSDILNDQVSTSTTPEQEGSNSPTSFADFSDAFTLTAGHYYEIDINQVTETTVNAVPEPGTLALFGAGLAGLGFFGFRRQRKTGGLHA